MKIFLNLFSLLLISSNIIAQNYIDTFDYEEREIHKAEVLFSFEVENQITFQKMLIEGHDTPLPFYHYLNSGEKEDHYIILLHGLGGSKEDWVFPSLPFIDWTKNLTAIKDSLLNLGNSILIPDAKYHGERSYELDFRPAEQLAATLSKSSEDANYFGTMISGTIKDIRIILDFIETNASTSSIKFSSVGYSMGGSLALMLNATDSRIKSVVACVPPLNLPEKDLKDYALPLKTVNKLKSITPQNYAPLQQSPYLLLMGEDDNFYTKQEVRSFLSHSEITDKDLKYFDSGHELPPEFVQEVIWWIRKQTND